MVKVKYKYIKLHHTIKLGSKTTLELEPQYLKSFGITAEVFTTEFGLVVHAKAEVRSSEEDEQYKYLIPYAGVRHILLAD